VKIPNVFRCVAQNIDQFVVCAVGISIQVPFRDTHEFRREIEFIETFRVGTDCGVAFSPHLFKNAGNLIVDTGAGSDVIGRKEGIDFGEI